MSANDNCWNTGNYTDDCDCERYEKGHKWQNIDRTLPKDYGC